MTHLNHSIVLSWFIFPLHRTPQPNHSLSHQVGLTQWYTCPFWMRGTTHSHAMSNLLRFAAWRDSFRYSALASPSHLCIAGRGASAALLDCCSQYSLRGRSHVNSICTRWTHAPSSPLLSAAGLSRSPGAKHLERSQVASNGTSKLVSLPCLTRRHSHSCTCSAAGHTGAKRTRTSPTRACPIGHGSAWPPERRDEHQPAAWGSG